MDEVWTIQRALEWTEGFLGRKGDENPRVSAQWLMAAATGLSRVELYVRFEQPLSMEERDVLRGFVSRRAAGEPLQYITGEVGFRHITVKTRRGVLIPRPETEVLVSEALALLPAGARGAVLPFFASGQRESSRAPAQSAEEGDGTGEEGALCEGGSSDRAALLVADLCTGSGCIACSLATERTDVRVIATDISPEAIALARENVADLGLDDRIDLIECDMGVGIDPCLLGRFDMVVSNPPYVPTAVLADIPREVADYEPTLALDGGADGLSCFRRILGFACAALKPRGGLAVELHETCLDSALLLAQAAGFTECAIARDLAGRPRILTARLP